ncbi:hypothetical protein ACN42_g1576 [Penicillium freii]|uniref:Uncharacterized protein n=1 Tax=Penicillium freii TaxID=48697 RepID=A0A117NRF5_PENFR|nr:hypothetical protein ACN42_g1576 [Penicillium freii]
MLNRNNGDGEKWRMLEIDAMTYPHLGKDQQSYYATHNILDIKHQFALSMLSRGKESMQANIDKAIRYKYI